ncbi:MAG: hypothetical protein WBL64_11140, partial [Nitrososphaeraceae archaeon]
MTSFVSLLARPIATVASLTALNLSASIIKQHTVPQFNNFIVQSLCFEHDFEDFFHIKYKSGKRIKFFLPRIFSKAFLGNDPSDGLLDSCVMNKEKLIKVMKTNCIASYSSNA